MLQWGIRNSSVSSMDRCSFFCILLECFLHQTFLNAFNEMSFSIFFFNSLAIYLHTPYNLWGFPGGSEVKASVCSVGDLGSILEMGRSPGERNGNPLQYSCLENPWMEEPSRLQSMGLQRVGHDWVTSLTYSLTIFTFTFYFLYTN